MLEHSQPDFRTTELDPEILSSPFKVQTNWQVLTGAPSSGKSTLIDLLADRDFRTVPETGRLVFEAEVDKGRTIEEIRDNMAAVQVAVFNKQLAIERSLPVEEVTFLDGAVPGSLAWYRAFGLDPNQILRDCFHRCYASVYLLDPLPFQVDGARDQDASIVGYLDAWIERDYRSLGYRVVRVPVLPLQERLAFVLERLSTQDI